MSSTFRQGNPIPSKRSLSNRPVTSLPGVRILATGSFVPDVVVPNSALCQLGCDEEWIVQRTGILERRHCRPEQSTSDLAYLAGRECLKNAGVPASEVDLIIVATMTPDHFTPSTSAIVQNLLGCQATGIDLNAACSGFMYGLVVGGQFIQNRAYRNVLVIGADAMSRVIDPEDVKTYPLFGDAAGAALLTFDSDADEDSLTGIRAWQMGTAGDLGHLISVPGSCARMPASEAVLRDRQQFLKMDGKPVFKWAVRTIPAAIHEVLELAEMSLDEIDVLLMHQANRRIIDAALEVLPIPAEKVLVNLQHYGNTSAASIPLLLDETLQKGVAALDNRILMCGFGAGLTWGTCIYQGRVG
jgi:3-oxoacyl-[acyl-carrier-protein] synthase-3